MTSPHQHTVSKAPLREGATCQPRAAAGAVLIDRPMPNRLEAFRAEAAEPSARCRGRELRLPPRTHRCTSSSGIDQSGSVMPSSLIAVESGPRTLLVLDVLLDDRQRGAPARGGKVRGRPEAVTPQVLVVMSGKLLTEPAGTDALEGADQPGQGDLRRLSASACAPDERRSDGRRAAPAAWPARTSAGLGGAPAGAPHRPLPAVGVLHGALVEPHLLVEFRGDRRRVLVAVVGPR